MSQGETNSTDLLLEKKGRELQDMIDGLNVAVFFVEPGYRVVRLNQAALRLSGHKTYVSTLGQKCHNLFFKSDKVCQFCPIEKNKKLKTFDEFFANHFWSQQEIFLNNASDPEKAHAINRKTYSQKQYFIQTFKGQHLLVELLADITEEKAKADIYHRNDKLIALGTVVQTIIHGLWNPLTGIRLTVESLLSGAENLNQKIQLLKKDIAKASSMMLELFGFLKRKNYRMTMVEIKKAVESSLQNSEPEKNLKVRWDWACDDKIKIRGNHFYLETIFENLVQNSLYFFKENQIKNPEILIRCRILKKEMRPLGWGNDHIKIEFIDNAGGISEKYLKRVFDPFFTTKKNKKNVGMGLAIVNKIVGEHYGSIEVHSIKTQTQFVLSFPLSISTKQGDG